MPSRLGFDCDGKSNYLSIKEVHYSHLEVTQCSPCNVSVMENEKWLNLRRVHNLARSLFELCLEVQVTDSQLWLPKGTFRVHGMGINGFLVSS